MVPAIRCESKEVLLGMCMVVICSGCSTPGWVKAALDVVRTLDHANGQFVLKIAIKSQTGMISVELTSLGFFRGDGDTCGPLLERRLGPCVHTLGPTEATN